MLQDGHEFAFTPPIEGSQNVEIFDPVVLLPKVLVLPWDPEGKSVEYQLLVRIQGDCCFFSNRFHLLLNRGLEFLHIFHSFSLVRFSTIQFRVLTVALDHKTEADLMYYVYSLYLELRIDISGLS
jgi:hypothetical protein